MAKKYSSLGINISTNELAASGINVPANDTDLNMTTFENTLKKPDSQENKLRKLWDKISSDDREKYGTPNIDIERILENRRVLIKEKVAQAVTRKNTNKIDVRRYFESIYQKPTKGGYYDVVKDKAKALDFAHKSIEAIEAEMMTEIALGISTIGQSGNDHDKIIAQKLLSELIDLKDETIDVKNKKINEILNSEGFPVPAKENVNAQRSILASARQHGKDQVRKSRQERRMEFFTAYQGQAENPREALEKAVSVAQEAVIVIQNINKERDLKDKKVPKPMKSTSSREDRVDTDKPSFKTDSELTAEDAAEEKRLAEAKIKSKGQIVGIGPGARDTKSFKSMLKKKEALQGLLNLVAPNERDVTFSELTERAEKEKPSKTGSMLSNIPGLGGKKVKIAGYLKTLKDMQYGSELKARDILEDIENTETAQQQVEEQITTHTAADVADNNRNPTEEIIESIPAADNDEKLTVAQNTLKEATKALDNHDAQQLAALIHLGRKEEEESLSDLKARAAEKLDKLIETAPAADKEQLGFLKSRLDDDIFCTALQGQIEESNRTMYLNDTGDPRKSQINSSSLKSDTTNTQSKSAGKMLMQSIASKSGIARGGIVEYKPGLDTSSRRLRCLSSKAVKKQEAINEGFIKEAIERKVFINPDVKDTKLRSMIERANTAVQRMISDPHFTAEQAQKSVFDPDQAPTTEASVAPTTPVDPTTRATEQPDAAEPMNRDSSDLRAASRGSSDPDAQVVELTEAKTSDGQNITETTPNNLDLSAMSMIGDTGNQPHRSTLHDQGALTGDNLLVLFQHAAAEQIRGQERAQSHEETSRFNPSGS